MDRDEAVAKQRDTEKDSFHMHPQREETLILATSDLVGAGFPFSNEMSTKKVQFSLRRALDNGTGRQKPVNECDGYRHASVLHHRIAGPAKAAYDPA